jgi:hypothetical protein
MDDPSDLINTRRLSPVTYCSLRSILVRQPNFQFCINSLNPAHILSFSSIHTNITCHPSCACFMFDWLRYKVLPENARLELLDLIHCRSLEHVKLWIQLEVIFSARYQFLKHYSIKASTLCDHFSGSNRWSFSAWSSTGQVWIMTSPMSCDVNVLVRSPAGW